MGQVKIQDEIVSTILGWANIHVHDVRQKLYAKEKHILRLWNAKQISSPGTICANTVEKSSGLLCIQVQSIPYSSVFKRNIIIPNYIDMKASLQPSKEQPVIKKETCIHLNLSKQPIELGAMAIPTKNERKAIWSNRKQLAKDAHYLPLVLQITNWAKSHKVKEIHRLLQIWEPPSPFQALQLLVPRVGDPIVRAYAIQQLEGLSNKEVSSILLQLVQTLQCEHMTESALLLFILRRVKLDPTIGQQFFWHVKLGFSTINNMIHMRKNLSMVFWIIYRKETV